MCRKRYFTVTHTVTQRSEWCLHQARAGACVCVCVCVCVLAGAQVQDFMRNMGLGMVADQLADLKLGELLDTPPPGLDEAVAIAKVRTCVCVCVCVCVCHVSVLGVSHATWRSKLCVVMLRAPMSVCVCVSFTGCSVR